MVENGVSVHVHALRNHGRIALVLQEEPYEREVVGSVFYIFSVQDVGDGARKRKLDEPLVFVTRADEVVR
mgnify:CR=1 FL=1